MIYKRKKFSNVQMKLRKEKKSEAKTLMIRFASSKVWFSVLISRFFVIGLPASFQ